MPGIRSKERWFALDTEQDVRHGNWLHWTGGAMNWNTMCADCHSTNLQQNYIAEADSFHTTWSSINVSCEACHGPGKKHVEFMESEKADEATVERIREDLKLTWNSTQEEQINQCATCHAFREKLTKNYDHSGDFLDHFNPTLPHPESYFADGQIKEEVYVYGSFLQSKMFKNGVKCSDCHNPHSLKLKANVTDNSLCMQCHTGNYNSRQHHFHKVNTEASQCISCHMPGRYYMEVDFRRDHSFRVPRPDLSDKFGTPNACNSCHNDQSAEWAAQTIEEWYGEERQDKYSEILVKADSLGTEVIPELKALVSDTAQPDIARATAIWYLGQFPSQQSRETLEAALNRGSPLMRISATRAFASFPQNEKATILQDALDDSLRAVRLAAAEGLAEFSTVDIIPSQKKAFNIALEEYKAYLDANQYFPSGQMNREQFFEKRDEIQKAIEAYQKAIEKDAEFYPARVNLAYLFNQQGKNDRAEELLKTVIDQQPSYGPAYYSLALLLAEENRLQETLPDFEKGAELMPENARLRYNRAIALQRMGRSDEAASAYQEAIERAPETPDYLYGICTLYIQQEQYEDALPYARKLAESAPQNPRFQKLLELVQTRMSQSD
ncbi:MAG: tetratricopeptide repeat protein [Balneolaceae bacterium]|nr:tetratricopeptide repeat protein [Balneolaceae bacterium]